MIFIPNEKTHPALNLAAEEYILTRMGLVEPILFFYINEPSIIVGRNQNTAEEIDRDFVQSEAIHVVRRLSGGGAVYHDFGNLCFSFISPFPDRPALDFKQFTAPILRALQALGVPAELSGRNDLIVDGAKFSGNAYYRNRSGSVCHGTLLFDTDLSVLAKALRPKPDKIQSKGIQSVRSRVVNLKQYLPQFADACALRAFLVGFIEREQDGLRVLPFSAEDMIAIERIAADRYQQNGWNYGNSPKYNKRVRCRFPFGEVDARLQIEAGRIVEARLFGDFFSPEEPHMLEQALSFCDFSADAIAQAAVCGKIGRIFPSLSVQEFVAFLMRS